VRPQECRPKRVGRTIPVTPALIGKWLTIASACDPVLLFKQRGAEAR
jgi:hypothetical protein